ncbi:MAG: hypothetical protein KDC39_07990 [Actinobacteria bacterium]|nr:hypothetical protein [Actinomycetota bacterium]
MGILILPLTLIVGWVLAILNLTPPGATDGEDFAVSALRWLFTIPAGYMFVASGIMHTVFAKSTAKNIGWQTNGFQYELGFVSLGIGAAGIVAAYYDFSAWLVLTIVVSCFLLGAAANHIKEMISERNYSPGNTWVLIYDIGLPASLIVLLCLS